MCGFIASFGLDVNQNNFKSALKHLSRRGPDSEGIWAENKVFLIGHVKNVYKFFKKGEIFVLSSLWEEVGFVMVEAALSNLFVISSNCPNGPSEFLENGQNGILFQNNKFGELTKSLKKYLNIENKKKHKYEVKKSTLKYSRFRHFIELEKTLK